MIIIELRKQDQQQGWEDVSVDFGGRQMLDPKPRINFKIQENHLNCGKNILAHKCLESVYDLLLYKLLTYLLKQVLYISYKKLFFHYNFF